MDVVVMSGRDTNPTNLAAGDSFITDEMVEAAELAMNFWEPPPGRAEDNQKPTWWDLAEAALAAAAPLLRSSVEAQLRNTIADEIHREARWQQELIMRQWTMPDPIARLLMLEKITRGVL